MTVLVVADATVMSAQDDLASTAQISHLESSELLLERTLEGSLSLQLLADVQAYLASDPADCDSLPQYLASLSASSSASGDDYGIGYSANATAFASPAAPVLAAQADNLTVVAPFSGAVPGALDLGVSLTVREVGGGGSVTLERRESHTLNLPISTTAASSLCASTTAGLASALSRSPCNSTLEEVAFDAVLPGLVAQASAQGFQLAAGWGSSGSCSASYRFTLVEPSVEGATGAFDWTVRGSGATA
jgi:hypothetical protein